MQGAACEERPLVQPRWVAALDGGLDGSLMAFAVWTIWYEVALWGRLSLWWPARIWIVLSVAIIVASVARAARMCGVDSGRSARQDRTPHEAVPSDEALRPRALQWVKRRRWALVYLSAFVLVLLVAFRERIGVVPVVLGSVLVLLVGLLQLHKQPLSLSLLPVFPRRPRSMAHLLAAGSCVGLAVLSSLLLKPDGDDVYYVNRATWVAAHGVPPIRDTTLGPGELPSGYIGGLPFPSIEALQGALAHVFYVQAPTLAYIVWVPALAAVFGWANWRLVRLWAPRRALLVHLGSLLFMLTSAHSIVGSYTVNRIWQGKVVAFIIVIPMIWYHLSHLLVRPSLWNHVMLLVTGVVFVGLTATAPLLTPVIVGAALLAAMVLRSRQLAFGAGVLLVAPLIAGIVVALRFSAVGIDTPLLFQAPQAFAIMLGGTTPMLVLGLFGVVLGVFLVPGRPAVLAACGSLVTMATLLPGVFPLANALTGAGPIIWRLLLGVPTWVLAGLLLASPLPAPWSRHGEPRGFRFVKAGFGALIPAALALLLVFDGTPIWSHEVGAQMTSRPTWKVDQAALADVRAAQKLRPPPGPWLLPPKQMEILSISSVKHFSVVPRSFYLANLPVSRSNLGYRVVLYWEAGGKPQPSRRVRRALTQLGVSVACVPGSDGRARRSLRRAVGEALRPVGGMRCHVGHVGRTPGNSGRTNLSRAGFSGDSELTRRR